MLVVKFFHFTQLLFFWCLSAQIIHRIYSSNILFPALRVRCAQGKGPDSETAFCLDYFSVFDSFTVHPSCLQRWHLSAVCPVGEVTARNHANNIKSGCVRTFLYKNTNKKQDFTLSVNIPIYFTVLGHAHAWILLLKTMKAKTRRTS